MKQLVYTLLMSTLLTTLVACGAPAAEPTAGEGESAPEEVFKVGVVTDVGEIDDKSFNQSSWEGTVAAVEAIGGEANYIETQSATDYTDNIAEFAEDGYDVIVTVGFALAGATTEAAAQYPDVDFIGIDQFYAEGDAPENVVGVVFNEDQAGYLGGYLAANLSESGTIAAVLGTDLVPPVVAFKEGYEAGALAANPDLNIISTYHPGGIDVAFTDPEWGAATTAQAIDQGADVVFAAGGKTGNGGLIEAAQHEGVFCIGVDTDQWFTVPEAHPCLVSSAMKLIDKATEELIILSSEDSFPGGGNYYGDVGLAPFHDFDAVVPETLKTELDELATALVAGEVTTGYGQ